MKWKPAATIPRDGTVIIAFTLSTATSPIYFGQDTEGREAWWCVDGGAYSHDDLEIVGWMELPPFPNLIDFYEKAERFKKEKPE